MSEQQKKNKGKKLVILLLVFIGILTGSAGFLANPSIISALNASSLIVLFETKPWS